MKYSTPETLCIRLQDDTRLLSNSLSTGDNTLHDSSTQKDKPAPGTGGDEPVEGGGDLDAAKRSFFIFGEF